PGRRSTWPIPASASRSSFSSFNLFVTRRRRRRLLEVGAIDLNRPSYQRRPGGSVNRPYLMKMLPMETSAREIAQRLRERGHIVYFAGGCVRDMVRGLPAIDFDIATDATL